MPTLKSIDRPNSAGGHSTAMTYRILQHTYYRMTVQWPMDEVDFVIRHDVIYG